MPEFDARLLPFLTRDMLSFEHGASFSLQVITRSETTDVFEVLGATKEGPFRFTFTPNGTNAAETRTFAIPDVPIFVSLHTSGIGIGPGEMIGTIYLRAGETRILQLCAGPVSTSQGIQWPATMHIPVMPGRGSIQSTTGTNPAAGAEVSQVVPDNQAWIVRAFHIDLVTDANAANRRVHFRFRICGMNPGVEVVSPVDQTASTTRRYHLLPGAAIPTTSDDDDIYISLPNDVILISGIGIQTDTVNGQAGDDFGAPQIGIEQFMLSRDD